MRMLTKGPDRERKSWQNNCVSAPKPPEPTTTTDLHAGADDLPRLPVAQRAHPPQPDLRVAVAVKAEVAAGIVLVAEGATTPGRAHHERMKRQTSVGRDAGAEMLTLGIETALMRTKKRELASDDVVEAIEGVPTVMMMLLPPIITDPAPPHHRAVQSATDTTLTMMTDVTDVEATAVVAGEVITTMARLSEDQGVRADTTAQQSRSDPAAPPAPKSTSTRSAPCFAVNSRPVWVSVI